MGVVLAGASVAVGPGWLSAALADLSDEELTDGPTLLALAGSSGRLVGEATLSFTDTYVAGSWTSVEVDDDPDAIDELERRCPPDDVLEVGLAQFDWRFVVRDDSDHPVAGAGLQEWEQILGHLGVLTAPDARGRGWATRAAAVATNEALDRGLVPQWRCRTGNTAFAALAVKLGYQVLGRQATVLLT